MHACFTKKTTYIPSRIVKAFFWLHLERFFFYHLYLIFRFKLDVLSIPVQLGDLI